MAFTGNFMCTSFKTELLKGCHDFTLTTGDAFKLALYTNTASFTAATTAYTATNEVGASGSYAAGGGTLTNITAVNSGTTAFTDFADLTFTTATITARGALIYKSGDNGAVCVLDFGNNKTSTTSFTVTMPANTSTSALIRIV